jgi:hypothetical protein
MLRALISLEGSGNMFNLTVFILTDSRSQGIERLADGQTKHPLFSLNAARV